MKHLILPAVLLVMISCSRSENQPTTPVQPPTVETPATSATTTTTEEVR